MHRGVKGPSDPSECLDRHGCSDFTEANKLLCIVEREGSKSGGELSTVGQCEPLFGSEWECRNSSPAKSLSPGESFFPKPGLTSLAVWIAVEVTEQKSKVSEWGKITG
jgi:hypothetical protein